MLFVAHHLLGDGRCLLALVNEFATSYVEERKPVYREEQLIKGFEDLPTHSNLPIVSSYLIRRLNKKWKQENVRVSYEEYLKFEETFTKENEVFMKCSLIEEAKLQSLKICCKEYDITINDLLMAAMYLVTNAKKIVIAVDLRNKLTCYREGALGNYASAISIVSTDTSKQIIRKAQKVHKKVRANLLNNQSLMLIISCYLSMNETLIDAAAIASLGTFNSSVARFVGEKMFGFQKRDGISITNLGKLENVNIKKALFFPPASPAMAQTLGVVTVNGKLYLCNCFYKKHVSVETVGTQFEEMMEVLNLHKLRAN